MITIMITGQRLYKHDDDDDEDVDDDDDAEDVDEDDEDDVEVDDRRRKSTFLAVFHPRALFNIQLQMSVLLVRPNLGGNENDDDV